MCWNSFSLPAPEGSSLQHAKPMLAPVAVRWPEGMRSRLLQAALQTQTQWGLTRPPPWSQGLRCGPAGPALPHRWHEALGQGWKACWARALGAQQAITDAPNKAMMYLSTRSGALREGMAPKPQNNTVSHITPPVQISNHMRVRHIL